MRPPPRPRKGDETSQDCRGWAGGGREGKVELHIKAAEFTFSNMGQGCAGTSKCNLLELESNRLQNTKEGAWGRGGRDVTNLATQQQENLPPLAEGSWDNGVSRAAQTHPGVVRFVHDVFKAPFGKTVKRL